MKNFSLITIFYIILIIGVSYFLLKQLYTLFHHGKLIIKVNKNSRLSFSWIVILIIWVVVLYLNMSDYIQHKENTNTDMILRSIWWIEFSIINIIGEMRNSEIRENGIYYFIFFYKWSQVESFNWESPEEIQFKVHNSFKIGRYIKLIIDEKTKSRMEIVIQRYLK